MSKWKIKEAEAIYTGGNIWLFIGSLTDGNYFLVSDDGWALILNADPSNLDESLYDDWQKEHLIEEMDEGEELRAFQIQLLDLLKSYSTNQRCIFDEEIENYRHAWNCVTEEPAKSTEETFSIRRDAESIYISNGKETEVHELSELGPVLRSFLTAYTDSDAVHVIALDYNKKGD